MGTHPNHNAGITEFIAALQDAGLHPNSRELANALWLADFIDRVTPGWSADDPAIESGQARDAVPGTPVGYNTALLRSTRKRDALHREPAQGLQSAKPKHQTAIPGFPTSASVATGGTAATAVAVPDRPFLRYALHLGRAWRPLRRARPSRRERFLDPEATAERLAEYRLNGHGFWEPVWRPCEVPWLNLTVIIDRGPAMPVWEPLINELLALLRRTKAFGQVRLRELETSGGRPRLREAGRVVPEKALGAPLPGSQPGRMLTLMVTDCVSRCWYDPATYAVVGAAARDGLLALLQLLPARRWLDTALGSGSELSLRPLQGRYPQLPSLEPSAEDSAFWEEGGSERRGANRSHPGSPIALPVSGLSPWGVRHLVDVVRGARDVQLIGYRFETKGAVMPGAPYAETPTPEERLRLFLSSASPAARRLAGYLSRLPYPLTVRIMQVIQHAMCSADDLSALAEVFSGGLLELHQPAQLGRPASYRILGQGVGRGGPGPVIRALGNLVSSEEAWTVLRMISQDLRRTGQHPSADWPLLIEAAAADSRFQLPTALLTGDVWERALALIAVDVARRLGGAYLRGGERLSQELQQAIPSPKTPPRLGPPTEPTLFRDVHADRVPGPEMIWLPGGRFTMGSPEGLGQGDEHPAHEVTLSHYGVGKYPVTVGEFRRFVEATGYRIEAETEAKEEDWVDLFDLPPLVRNMKHVTRDASWRVTELTQDDTRPVVFISWNDAQAYCRWLSEHTRQIYGLLTEAQWEYACRAGSTTAYWFGDDAKGLADYGWYRGNAGNGTRPVGGQAANAWHLHDMHGNVWEWCADWYGQYSSEAQQDPRGPKSGSSRVVRGGSWLNHAGYCRSACRSRSDPGHRDSNLGFRLSRTGSLDSYPFVLGPPPAEFAPEPEAPLPWLRDTLADAARGRTRCDCLPDGAGRQ